jgi:hypothetical protein
VVEVAEEEVLEDLLGGAELAVGLAGWGEQLEMAATGEVLMEEDDGGEIPWPGFASRHCRQALGAGGARQ